MGIKKKKLDEITPDWVIVLLEELGDFPSNVTSTVILTNAFCEQIVNAIVGKFFPTLFKSEITYSQSLDLLHDLKVIDASVYRFLKCLNKIRNNHAHNFDYIISLNILKSGINPNYLQKDSRDSIWNYATNMLYPVMFNVMCREQLVIFFFSCNTIANKLSNKIDGKDLANNILNLKKESWDALKLKMDGFEEERKEFEYYER